MSQFSKTGHFHVDQTKLWSIRTCKNYAIKFFFMLALITEDLAKYHEKTLRRCGAFYIKSITFLTHFNFYPSSRHQGLLPESTTKY